MKNQYEITKSMINHMTNMKNHLIKEQILREFQSNDQSLQNSNDNQVSNDTTQSNDGIVSLDINNDLVNNFIEDIIKLMPTANLQYDNLTYNKKSGEVKWSGSLSELNWSMVYNPKAKGFYIETSNVIELSLDDTKYLNLLNNYLSNDWFTNIQQAIRQGTLK